MHQVLETQVIQVILIILGIAICVVVCSKCFCRCDRRELNLNTQIVPLESVVVNPMHIKKTTDIEN